MANKPSHGLQEKKKKKKRKSETEDGVEGADPAEVPAEVAGTAAVINPGEETPEPKKKKKKKSADT